MEKNKCDCEPCECTEENNCGCIEDSCECGEPCDCTEENNCGCIEDSCECGEPCDCTEENNCGCIDDSRECGESCDCTEEDNCGCMEEPKKKKKKLKKEDELALKVIELENELLKSKAEFINYRKRLDMENARYLKFCNEGIIKQMLPNLDNFERAINMDDDNLTDEVSKFLSGMKMIYCNLTTILKDNGVTEIDGNNKPFDPNYHEAIMTEKKDGMEPLMVIEVLQKGYILKDKVIRPAMVRVSE